MEKQNLFLMLLVVLFSLISCSNDKKTGKNDFDDHYYDSDSQEHEENEDYTEESDDIHKDSDDVDNDDEVTSPCSPNQCEYMENSTGECAVYGNGFICVCNDLSNWRDNRCIAFATIYVDSRASSGGNGKSWATAISDLHVALELSYSGDQIWVAKGKYRPSGNGSGTARHFKMKKGVAIYGGFLGTEETLDERDWSNNITILSGDLSGDDFYDADGDLRNYEENALNVFHHKAGLLLDESAILDGFTIKSGRGDNGGGMYNDRNSPTIRNCVFTENWASIGGGMYNTQSSPEIIDTVFIKNKSSRGGGGLYNDKKSSPQISGTKFIENKTNYDSSPFESGGGGVFNSQSSPVFTKTDFIRNDAYDTDGGGVFNFESDAKFIECSFTGNSAKNGSGMYNKKSSPEIFSSLFQFNFIGIGNKIQGGAGMFNLESTPVIKNSVFKGNQAYSLMGGAIYNISSGVSLINSVFLYNLAKKGGALYNKKTDISIVNCSFSFNEGKIGGALANEEESNVKIINSILYNNYGDKGFAEIGNEEKQNVDISYSNIKESKGSGYKWNSSLGNDLGGNIDEDPVYSMNNLHPLSISAASPCVDKGTRSPLSLEIKEDLLGGDRIFGESMDIGAYEYNGICQPEICNIEGSVNRCLPLGKTYECECHDGYFWSDKDKKCKKRNIIYVRFDDGSGGFTTEDGISWETAFISINTAINNAKKGDMIWVQKGLYFPDGYPNGGSDQKELHFTLKNGVQIFGGFEGTETELDQRDVVKNETILSGDFHQDDEWDESSLTWKNREDNFYHIFYMPDGVYIDQTAMLDGFILEGGNPGEHIVNNHSKDSGGAIFIENGSALIKNCVFRKSGSSAVGINNFNGISFEISNCKFTENFDGQAIIASGRIKIENCEFSNNISIEHAIVGAFGDMTEIRGSLFSNNRGKSTGISSRNTIIEDTSFIGNAGSGFGLFRFYADTIMKNVVFKENISDPSSGGTLYSEGNFSCDECLFEKNVSSQPGGALYLKGVENLITNSVFRENISDVSGGAVAAFNIKPDNPVNVTIENSVFEKNHSVNGGAVENRMYINSKIINSFFIENTATGGGGAIYNTRGISVIAGSVFSDNSSENGGGIYITDNSAEIINCTISGNTAQKRGGGFYNQIGISKVINTIVWGNTADVYGNETFNADYPDVENDYIIFMHSNIKGSKGSGMEWVVFLGEDGGGNIDSDPLFSNIGAHPYSLESESPCIDAGDNTFVADLFFFDAAGGQRILNNIVDIGAYEF